jgi:hypothetical protein
MFVIRKSSGIRSFHTTKVTLGYSQLLLSGNGIALPSHSFKKCIIKDYELDIDQFCEGLKFNNNTMSYDCGSGIVLFYGIVSVETTSLILNDRILGPLTEKDRRNYFMYKPLYSKVNFEKILHKRGIKLDDPAVKHLGEIESYNGRSSDPYIEWLSTTSLDGKKIGDMIGHYIVGVERT